MDATSPALAEVLLARHALRRADGLPTVSVLLGPVGAALRAWRVWISSGNRPVIAGSAAEVLKVANLYTQSADRERDLFGDSCAFLAAHIGRPVAELQATVSAMTRQDLDVFFSANEGQLPATEATRLARRVLEAVIESVPPKTENWLASANEPLAVLSGLASLIPTEALPALVLHPPSSTRMQDWFETAGAAAVAVATRVPTLPLAIAIPPDVWANYLTTAPESRVKATLREGTVEIPVLNQSGVERVLAQAGIQPTAISPTLMPVIASGVPEAFATALATSSAAPVQAATEQDDDEARSAAERFLFQFLELLPDTAGRFELNTSPGFRFRSRAAEIDLLSPELRIAIEIDGYYHFRDADGYRRDREKDWELQRHGFLVLRFLADDIIPRLEEVRDRILAAVALQTAETHA